MIKSYPVIGMQLDGSNDYMAVEQWPLVQASASEDYGGHGFFTLNHQVIDITSLINKALFSHVDCFALELLRERSLGPLSVNYVATLANIDRVEPGTEMNTTIIAEPLTAGHRHVQVLR